MAGKDFKDDKDFRDGEEGAREGEETLRSGGVARPENTLQLKPELGRFN